MKMAFKIPMTSALFLQFLAVCMVLSQESAPVTTTPGVSSFAPISAASPGEIAASVAPSSAENTPAAVAGGASTEKSDPAPSAEPSSVVPTRAPHKSDPAATTPSTIPPLIHKSPSTEKSVQNNKGGEGGKKEGSQGAAGRLNVLTWGVFAGSAMVLLSGMM